MENNVRKIVRQVLSESLLNERLNDVDSDVNFLYDKYFKNIVDLISSGNNVTERDFLKSSTIIDTSILSSEDCVKAHSLNPCELFINRDGNYYRPFDKKISIGFNENAVEFLLDNGQNISDALKSLADYEKENFKQEFTESKIKGTINHELLHWIDDTLNNQHLRNKLNKAKEIGSKNFKGIPFNSSKIEIQGQMGNIKQLYNDFKNKNELKLWNSLRFIDLINLSPTLSLVYRQLKGDIRQQWIRNIMKRMHREGLLGDRMNYLD